LRIVHIHVPKTAGTALRKAFETHNNPKLRVCPAIFEKQYESVNFADFDVFSGHISYSLAKKIDGDMITVLRDPIDRFLSVYYFWRQLYAKGVERTRNTTLATNYELADFVTLFDERTLIEEFYNRLTWQLASSFALDGPDGRSGWRHQFHGNEMAVLELAKENLSKFKIVGIQERYSSVLTKLNQLYGLHIEDKKINVTEEREHMGSLNSAVLSKIYQWVYLDIELYKFALRTFA
jgi:hypothetical protein